MFPQGPQYHSQMDNVFIYGFGVIQEILYKYHHELVQIGYENSIHKIHEGRGGIGQANRHHGEFIVTKPSPELGF